MPDEELYLYTNATLWPTEAASKWLFIEVPDDALRTFEATQQDPQELFTLSARGLLERDITVRLPSDDFSLVEVQKYPAALVVGMVYPIVPSGASTDAFQDTTPTPAGSSATPSRAATSDCYLAGQQHCVLTLRPTYPRLNGVEELFRSSPPKFPLPTSPEGTATWMDHCPFPVVDVQTLVERVQASETHLQHYLLSGLYVYCPPNFWIAPSYADLVAILHHSCQTVRLQSLSFLKLSWRDALAMTRTEGLLYKCPSSVLIQLLAFLCDMTSEKPYPFDTVLENTSLEHYVDAVETFGDDVPLTLTLNLNKVGRILLRYHASEGRKLPAATLVERVMMSVLESLPPDVLDYDTFERRDTEPRGWLRGDSDQYSALSEMDLWNLHDIVANDLRNFMRQWPSLFNLRHLIGYAIDVDTIVQWLPHYELPWDWKQRLLRLYELKSTWSLEELDIYLQPLRRFDDVPSMDAIVVLFLAKTAGSNDLYFYRRVRIQD